MTTPLFEPDVASTNASSTAQPAASPATGFKVGDSDSITRTITQELIAAFAAVSGDDQPLHLDADFAATSRFGGIVAHGMLSGAIFSALLGKKLPGEGTILLGMNLTFSKPVRPGDVITYRGEIAAIGEKGRMEIALAAFKENGEQVAAATAGVLYRR